MGSQCERRRAGRLAEECAAAGRAGDVDPRHEEDPRGLYQHGQAADSQGEPRTGHPLPHLADAERDDDQRRRQRHRLHVAARARHRPLAHQHHGQRRAHERRRERTALLGEHGRLRLLRAVDADTARRGHVDQRRRCLRRHAEHADREHRHQALRGRRPQRRLLLQPQGDGALRHRPHGRALGAAGPPVEPRLEGLPGPRLDEAEQLPAAGRILRRQHRGEAHHLERH